KHKGAVIVGALVILIVAFGFILPSLGTEFVPTLSEGAIEINMVRVADTPLETSIAENTLMEQAILKAFPDEVDHVWRRIGTAEVATDPMGIELTDTFISLKPRHKWTKATSQAELTELLQKELRPFLGVKLAFAQPIQERIDEMESGTKQAVA